MFRGVKIDHLAEDNLCLQSALCLCERVQIISCDANPGSFHGDSSYHDDCVLSVFVSTV